jgi:uncharacterized protein YuzE
MEYRYDEEADALYISLSSQPYAYGEEIDLERRIDYSEDGNPIGAEILCVSDGVDVRDLPEAREIARLLSQKQVRIRAS